MPAIHASRHHGLLDLADLRKRAKRLLKAVNNGEAGAFNLGAQQV